MILAATASRFRCDLRQHLDPEEVASPQTLLASGAPRTICDGSGQ